MKFVLFDMKLNSRGRSHQEQRSAAQGSAALSSTAAARFRCSHTSRAARPVPVAMEEFVSTFLLLDTKTIKNSV